MYSWIRTWDSLNIGAVYAGIPGEEVVFDDSVDPFYYQFGGTADLYYGLARAELEEMMVNSTNFMDKADGTYFYAWKNGGFLQVTLSTTGSNRDYTFSVRNAQNVQYFYLTGTLNPTYFPYLGFCVAYDGTAHKMYFGSITGNLNEDTRSCYITYVVPITNIYEAWGANVGPDPGPGGDPYGPGDYSKPEQTTGTFDDESEIVSIPTAPTILLSANGLLNVWAPSLTQLNDFANYLWGNFDKFDSNKLISKFFTSPLDSVLSLHMLPFTPSTSTAIQITLCGAAIPGVTMPPCAEQFHDVDCGSLAFEEYWGNYLDYNPFTKITLCLPFVGQVDLDPDEVMGEEVSVLYRVDVVTGAFVCFVSTTTKVIGQYSGNCMLQVPVSAASFGEVNRALVGLAGAAAGAIAGAATGGLGAVAGGAVISSAFNVTNSKVRVSHASGLSSAPGFMGIQKPYVIIHRPRQSVPEDYYKLHGYPLNVTKTLSSCEGFTTVRDIKLDGLSLTDPEVEQLRTILEQGVFI